MQKKIITIIGARPQFIKAAPVSQQFKNHSNIIEKIIHTGQHYDANMTDVFFEELEIPKPHYFLNIGSDTHGRQTGNMLAAIEEVLLQEKPNWVLIYGDTNSTLAGALAASKLNIPIAHVEAGLRSFNRKMPEEINRVVADHLSTLLFPPTQQAVINLENEGFQSHQIVNVGDVMYDAALYYGAKAEQKSHILEQQQLESQKYILATIHRPENTDNPERLKNIFYAFETIAKEIPIILPLHPRTRKFWLETFHDNIKVSKNLKIIEPVGFLDMVMLEKNAALIATDSGGVQKEAFFYHIPCITLRDETEWVELVDLGWNEVIQPNNTQLLIEKIKKNLGKKGNLKEKPYGNGTASQKIAQRLG